MRNFGFGAATVIVLVVAWWAFWRYIAPGHD